MKTITTDEALKNLKRSNAQGPKYGVKPRMKVGAGGTPTVPNAPKRTVGGALRKVGQLANKSYSLPKTPKGIIGKAGVLGAAYSGITGLIDGISGVGTHTDENVDKRGGTIASFMKDAFPTLSGYGTQLGERLAGKPGAFSAEPMEDLGPGIELTEGAVNAIERNKNKGNELAQTTITGDVGYTPSEILERTNAQLPVVPEPAMAVSQANDSYFVNNGVENVKGGRGVAPGERQYLRDLPQSFPEIEATASPAPQQSTTPQRVSRYDVPEPALNLPKFNTRTDSYGDLLAKTLQIANQGLALLPGQIAEKRRTTQRGQNALDRDFDFDMLKHKQNTGIKIARFNQNENRASENKRSNNLNLLARLRGQDIQAADNVKEPLTYSEQLEEQNALTEISLQQFESAPPSFAAAVPNLVRNGASLKQVQNAYQQVVALQTAATGDSPAKLDPQELYNEVARVLGQ